MKKTCSLLAKSGLIILAAYVIKLCKISFMIGSGYAFFSFSSSLLPLTGAFGGVVGAGLLLLTKIMLFSSKTFLSGQFLAFVLPGLSASLYWAVDSVVVRLLLPIVCMVLFVAHPVGSAAFTYSLLWLIPVVLYFVNKNSVILNSLASTFVAHAVGSVIWLYTVPMQSAEWIALIPVALTERILLASGMVMMHCLFSSVFAAKKKEIASKTLISMCN